VRFSNTQTPCFLFSFHDAETVNEELTFFAHFATFSARCDWRIIFTFSDNRHLLQLERTCSSLKDKALAGTSAKKFLAKLWAYKFEEVFYGFPIQACIEG
jgi:hypothetical protein